MEILEIKNSSAISKVTFNNKESIVGICFTYKPDSEYLYHCETINDVKEQLLQVESEGGSIGKLINSFRKDGTFEQLEV
jgi:hypothetical protein